MTGVFNKHGLLKVVPLETAPTKLVADRKVKHTVSDITNDPDVIKFCLNCTKATCAYGTCIELEEFINAKKAKREILHP